MIRKCIKLEDIVTIGGNQTIKQTDHKKKFGATTNKGEEKNIIWLQVPR